jgi:hypothetical protein
MAAVDEAVSAGDSGVLYRPQESPANGHINGNAGDAVGTLLSFHCDGDLVFLRKFLALNLVLPSKQF